MVMKFKVMDYVGGNGNIWKRAIRLTNGLRGEPQEAVEVYWWCREQFGMNSEGPEQFGMNSEGPTSHGVRWCCSRDGYSAYYFRNSEDCEWFLLRWS
jgi:hypothetical protein